jgi:gliding motility-associated-like protein
MPTVPSYTVNLSAKADTTWISPSIVRRDNCCGTSNPDRCVQFIITLNSRSAGIVFNIASGAIPSGSMYYQVGCLSPTPVGSIICLNGRGPHILTFCKPGNNANTYSIRAIPKPYASDDIRIHEGCVGQIAAYGFNVSTIRWTSIYPSTVGRYNNYLSCTTGCANVTVTPQPGFPPYVDYRVCGTSTNGCVSSPFCDTVRVFLYPKLTSYLFPPMPTYCFLDSGLYVSSGPVGGAPPYKYLWSNGATTSKTFVSAGTYTLRISDQTGCPPVYDTIQVTIDTPDVDAGPGDTVCFGYSGSVGLRATGALYYEWQPDSTLSALNIANPRATPSKTTTYYVSGFSTVGEYLDNGDFSKGNIGFTSSYGYRSNLFPEGYYFIGPNPRTTHPNWCICGDHTTGTGNMMIINGATVAGVPVYTKNINVVPYTSYAVSIWIQSVHPANPAKLQFSVNGSLLGAPFTILSTVGLWQNFYTIWYSGASTTATISIVNQNTIANGNDFALDDISFASVCPNQDSVTVYVSHIDVKSNIQNNNCYHGQNGAIDIQVSGGIAPYKFSWSNGDTTEDLSNIMAGKYYLQITDLSGCTYADSFIITEPPKPLVINDSVLNVKCYGNNSGSILINIVNGTSPFTFNWSDGSHNQDLTNIPAGIYSVSVTDSSGCMVTDTFTVIQPDSLEHSSIINNVKCNGNSDGSIIMTVMGGMQPYSYQWSNNSVSKDLLSLTAGNYSVVVTDSNGCTFMDSFIITQPSPLSISLYESNVKCFNGNDGSIDINVSGGTSPYSYLWSNSQTTEDINNLAAGGYGVTVTDSHGCIIRDSAVITQPTQLMIGKTFFNVNCFGGSNGSIDLSVRGGISPYSFKWTNGQITEDIQNLTSGVYIVTVTDSNGCSVKDTSNISQPADLGLTYIKTDVKCYNENNGTINITVTGGTVPYQYKWSNNQVTEDIINLIAGGYGVVVTDSHGCKISDSIIISEPTLLMIGHSHVNVRCYNDSSGSIMLFLTGGTTPYKYNWNNGRTTKQINNLLAGFYKVTVTDSNGCVVKDSAVISQPDQLTINHTLVNVSCYNWNNGKINIDVNGGVAPYKYNWSNNSWNEDQTGLIAGQYNVVVSDSQNCITSDTFIIAQPGELTTSMVSVNVSCYNGGNGLINLTVNGGTIPYSYTWSNGPVNQDIYNLQAGKYSVIVKDSQNCEIRDSIIITQPMPLRINQSSRNVSCKNGTDGSINITVIGGTTPYRFIWSGGQNTEDISQLNAGSYVVTVTDTNGCEIKDSVVITEPDHLSISYSSTNVSCFNFSDGTINITVNGGVTPYSYTWSNNSGIEDQNGLAAGKYSVLVTDTNGCTIMDSVSISQPAQLTMSNQVINVKCFNGADGSIDVAVNGGTKPYNYRWTNGHFTEDLNNIKAGRYSLIVTDSNSCQISDSFVITEPNILATSHLTQNVSCNGGNDGSVNLTVTGGTSPYSYRWTNGQFTQDLINLTAGGYCVYIIDSNGCFISDSAIITQPHKLVISHIINDVSCFNISDGSIDITVGGGVMPYSYRWSNNSISEDQSILKSGWYYVEVTDSHACVIEDSAYVDQPTQLSSTHTIIHASCFNDSNGVIDLTVTGGTTPYFYRWSNSQTTQDISNLRAGNYSVMVMDSHGCVIADSAIVEHPTQLSVNHNIVNVSCYNGNNGSISLTVSGGTSPYSYIWSNNKNTRDVSNLVAGSYMVMISDSQGCKIWDSAVVGQPNQLSISHTQNNVSCFNGNDGSINITVNGGTMPYSYKWSNGPVSEDISNLTAGGYGVTVSDSQGCIMKDTLTISQPTKLVASHTMINANCYNESNGSINLTVSGGTLPYSYSWSNGQKTEDVSNLVAGRYIAVINDSNGCITMDTTVITQPNELTLGYSRKDLVCYNDTNGSIDITNNGGTLPYSYIWSNSKVTQDISGLSAGVYSVIVKDDHNCLIKDTFIITEPDELTFDHQIYDVRCYGGNDGSVILNVYGGVKPYNYLWSDSSRTKNISNLKQGRYIVVISDSLGCIKADTMNVNQPLRLTSNFSVKKVNCFGGNDGSISVSVNGGIFPYQYNWSNGDTLSIIDSVTSGSYILIVTDQNSCQLKDTISVGEPLAPMTLSVVTTNVKCNGNKDGEIDIAITGGTTPYNYIWSNNSNSEDQFSLIAGIYSVTVKDTNGCIIQDTFSISEPDILSVSSQIKPVICHGGAQGEIIITANGGTLPYHFSWSTGDTTSTATSLKKGIYTLLLKDSNGCSLNKFYELKEPVKMLYNAVKQNVKCFNESNGSVDISISGGIPPYGYIWSNGKSSSYIDNLVAGTYYFLVFDSIGCSYQDSVVITQPDILVINKLSYQNVTCYGLTDGFIDITVTGGTLPYFYTWNNGHITQDIKNLNNGKYKVVVTDSNNCTISDSVELSKPSEIQIIASQKDVTCPFGDDGRIEINVLGGTQPFRYNWSNGSVSRNIDSIKAGLYDLVVEDSMNCKGNMSFEVFQPAPISLVMEINNATCFNKRDGSITVHATGGSSPYKFTWSNGDTSSKISKLGAGLYTISVEDKHICKEDDSANVDQPPPVLIVDYTIRNISCYTKKDGSIEVNVRGGTPPYTFDWSNKEHTQNIIGLASGYYAVTVSDANYCVYIDSLRIIEPMPLDIQYFTKDEKCKGDKDGYINLSITGGVNPYHFLWSTKDTVEDIKNLSPGYYSVDIKDANGCGIKKDNIKIATTPLPEPDIYSEEHALYCDNDSLILGVSEPFVKYMWNTGDTGRYLVVKTPGSYFVTVVDKNECTDTSSKIRIDVYNPYERINLKDEYFFCPDEESEITLYPGIISGATYEWLPTHETTPSITVSEEGVYSVNIKKGTCNVIYTAHVYEVCEPVINVPNVFTPNGDGYNETFFPVTLYIDTLTFIIFNKWGEILYRGYGVDDKWDGTYQGETVMQDTYCYVLLYKNRQWKWQQKSGSVNVLR